MPEVSQRNKHRPAVISCLPRTSTLQNPICTTLSFLPVKGQPHPQALFYSPTTGLIKQEQCFCFSKYPCQTAGSHYGYRAVGGQNISQMFEMSNGQACHFHLLSCWDVDSQSTLAGYISGKPNPISSLTPQ